MFKKRAFIAIIPLFSIVLVPFAFKSVMDRMLAEAAQMGPPIPMTSQQLTHTARGGSVELVVRIESIQRQIVSAMVLDRKTDTEYATSKVHAQLDVPEGTPVVMGTLRDLVPKAIVYVTGVVTRPSTVDVKKVVVLTLYVKVD